MRIFSSAVEAVKEIERDLWEMGHRVNTKSFQDKTREGGYDSVEMVGYSFTLLNGSDWRDVFKTLGYGEEDATECMDYVEAELLERSNTNTTGSNPGNSWVKRKKIWSKFLLPDGRFSYTYRQRLTEKMNQYQLVHNTHQFDPNSRQLIYLIYQAEDQWRTGGVVRIPCTMYYQFLERGEDLYLIHNMRSCDLYTHFPIDMSLTWLMCACQAGIWKKTPKIIMQIGSLHAFEENMKQRKIF